MNMGQYQEEFLIFLLGTLCLGIVAGWAFPALPFVPMLIVLIGLMIWAAWGVFHVSRQVWPAFLLAAFLLGLLRMQASLVLPYDDISHFAGQELKLEGRITEEPQAKERSDGIISVRYCLQAENIRPSKEECYRNPRAHSTKLRFAVKN